MRPQLSRKSKNRKVEKGSAAKWIIVLLCLHVILGLLYWHQTRFGLPPDEGPHGLYVQHLADDRAFPVLEAGEKNDYEKHQPPLYYMLGVPFLVSGRALGLGEPMILVRLLSLILGGLSIFIVYRAVKEAFGDEWLGVGAAGFVALLPTHVMISSSVSNDVPTELIFGLFLLIGVRMLNEGLDWKRSVYIGIILGAGILVKAHCMLLFPVCAFLYFILWRRGGAFGKAASHLGAALLIAMMIGGWWLLRNYNVYGDVFAMKRYTEVFGEINVPPQYWYDRGFMPWQYAGLVVVNTFASFWGVFGHMNIFMPTWIYYVLGALFIWTSAVLVPAIRGVEEKASVYLFGAVVLIVTAAFIGINMKYFQAMGRYLYPALLPFAAFWAIGVKRAVPAGAKRYYCLIIIATAAFVQAAALATCIFAQVPYK